MRLWFFSADMIRSPLVRRVTASVFVSILFIEALILLPSYLRQEEHLLADVADAGRNWADAITRSMPETTRPKDLAQAILGSDIITGVVLSGAGSDISVGEPIPGAAGAGNAGQTRGTLAFPRTGADGTRHDIRLNPGETASPYRVFLRLDISHVQTELRNYVLRITGLVVIITAVLTAATILAMNGVVLKPLATLRDALDRGSLADGGPEAGRNDEIGDVYRATAVMLGQLQSTQDILETTVSERTGELERQKAVLEATLANIQQGVAVYDEDLRLVLWNDYYAGLRGFPKDFLSRQPHLSEVFAYQAEKGSYTHVSGSAEQQVAQMMEAAIGTDLEHPTEQVRADGTIHEMRSQRLPGGGFIRTFIDITERKQIEESQKAVLNAITVPVFVVSEHDTYFYANTQAAALIGRPGADITGEPLIDIYAHADDRARFAGILERDGKVDDFEAEIRLPQEDGATDGPGNGAGWALISARTLIFKGEPAVLTAVSVITKRKRAEEALRQSEARLRAIMDNVPILLTLKDTEGHFQFMNERYAEWLSLPMDEILGKTVFDLLPEDRAQMLRATEEQILATGETQDFEAVSLASSHSDRRFVQFIKFPVHDDDGAITGLGTAILDITERKHAEREMQRFMTAIDSFSEGISIYDADDRFVFCNTGFREINRAVADTIEPGMPFEGHLRALVDRGLVPQANGREEAWIDARLQRHRAPRGPFELERQDGRWLRLIEQRLADGWTITQASDITAEKIAEQAVERNAALLKLSLDNMTDGIFVLDTEMRYQVFNDRYVDLMELAPGDVAPGMAVRDIILRLAHEGAYGTGDPETLADERMASLRTGEYVEREIFTSSGRILHARKAPIETGGAVVTVTDITRRKHTEKVITQAREAADAANQAKSDFVAMVSHEVRTPMNGVLGMARLMRETPLDRDQRHSLETVISSAESLLRIVNDLLDISKLDAGHLELESIPFGPADAVENSVAVLTGQAREKGLNLTIDAGSNLPDVVVGDPYRLRQVLMNLISNAIKFTPAGSVTVRLRRVSQKEKIADLEFAVIDTGQGIRPEHREKLFSPFTQATVEIARKHGGTGLGLAICRRLVDLMGGVITLETEVDRGSSFSFRLALPVDTETDPAALSLSMGAEMAVSPSAAKTQASGADALKLLQVEDNDTNADLVERLMRRAGHTIVSVGDGAQALERLAEETFDLIIMDRHMPVMDGLEATRRIRALPPPLSSIPIVGITAGALPEELQACLDAGMDTVLTKPVDDRVLRLTVARLGASAATGLRLRTDRPVLVVDDVHVNLAVADKQLSKLGVPCEIIEDPEAALEMLRTGAYAMAIVDINMPRLSGIELTKQLRQWEQDKGRYTPVIAMTGDASAEAQKEFQAAGLDGHLAKPVSIEVLSDILGKWLADTPQQDNPEHDSGHNVEDAPEPEETAGPPVDLRELSTLLGEDDPEELFAMLDLFVASFPDLMVPLTAAVTARRADDLHDAAHAAKSAALSAAAGPMAETLQQLETEARAQARAKADGQIKDIDWENLTALSDRVGVEFDDVADFCRARGETLTT